MFFCQSENLISKFELANGRLIASKRNTLNTLLAKCFLFYWRLRWSLSFTVVFLLMFSVCKPVKYLAWKMLEGHNSVVLNDVGLCDWYQSTSYFCFALFHNNNFVLNVVCVHTYVNVCIWTSCLVTFESCSMLVKIVQVPLWKDRNLSWWWYSADWFRLLPFSYPQQLEQIQKELSVLEEDIKRVEVRCPDIVLTLAIFHFHQAVCLAVGMLC